MKYYAVTDDPNELMHYGIKGMKWGVIRTDAQLGHPKKPSRQRSSKPKSPAYQKAAAKLSAAMHHGIAKAQANWKAYNSPENKELRRQQHEVDKAVRDYKRGERLFEKHVQLARQGRLKYKGISDAEVQRITDRLALERNARMLSGTEKPSLRRRVNEAIGEGIVRGVGQGMSGYITARMTGRGNTDAKIRDEKRMAKFHNSLRGRLADWREDRADMRAAIAEQKRANAKAVLRDQYEDARQDFDDRKKAADERRKNELELNALISAGKDMNYGSIYDDSDNRPKLSYRVKDTSRLSDAEVRGRLLAMQGVKKLYESSEDSRIKNKNGTITEERTDPVTNEKYTVTYGGKGGGKQKPKTDSAASNQTPTANATPHAARTPARSIHTITSQAQAARARTKNRMNLAAQSQRMIDSIAQDESERASTEYWKRIHDFNAAAQRASERKAAQEEAARAARLREEGFAERENRLAYRDAVSSWAREKSNLSGNRRTKTEPSVHVTRVQNFGNTYEYDTPLFWNEKHRSSTGSRRAPRKNMHRGRS